MSRISRKFSNIFSNYLLKFKWTQGDHTHVIHKSAVFTQEKWTLRYIHNCTEMLTAALFIIIKKKKKETTQMSFNCWMDEEIDIFIQWYITQQKGTTMNTCKNTDDLKCVLLS